MKKSSSKVNSGHTPKHHPIYASVHCDKHGRRMDNQSWPEVRVAMPSNKRQRMSGCPICAGER